MNNPRGAPVALLGGTFDPVHYGHLRPAIELLEALNLSEIRLMPGHVPPHRSQPRLGARARADLLDTAVAGIPGLVVDRCELDRPGPSYTVDTLHYLRRALGDRRPLCFIMGKDAFRGLMRWHEWWRLASLAHLVVVTRGGETAALAPALDEWMHPRLVVDPASLRAAPSGYVLFQTVSGLEISATGIRRCLALGYSAQGLMPDAVWHELALSGCYGYPQVSRAITPGRLNPRHV